MTAATSFRQLTRLDHVRLSRLIEPTAGARAPSPAAAGQAADVLDFADVVEPRRIAASVVTMRSRVVLRRAAGEALDLTLVYPDEADAAAGRVSVFSPLGLALLGTRRGDTVEWRGPRGERHQAEVEAILYQPEAAGHYDR